MAQNKNTTPGNKLSTVQVRLADPKKRMPKGATRILNEIFQMGRSYSNKSLKDWRIAVQSAENPLMPNRTRLYDLYEDLSYDLHYVHLRRKLETYATGSKYMVIDPKTKKPDEEGTTIFESEWFENFVELIVETLFKAHSLLEVKEANPETFMLKFELVPRKHVVPEKGAWTTMPGGVDYQYYRDTPAMDWLIELGKPKNLGWMNLIAKEIIFKKVSFITWSEFQERFGHPLVKAKTATRDKLAVDRMETFLKDLGRKSYAIIDQADDIDFAESVKTDSHEVFDRLIERTNSEMSKAILLQIMASDVGENGSRAQAEVHLESGGPALKAFLRCVEYVVNDKLIPLLVKHGFPLEGKKFRYAETKVVDKDTFEQHKWLYEMFDIDPSYFGEVYGVPIKAAKEKKEPAPVETTEKLKKMVEAVSASDFHKTVKLHAGIAALYKDCCGDPEHDHA